MYLVNAELWFRQDMGYKWPDSEFLSTLLTAVN